MSRLKDIQDCLYNELKCNWIIKGRYNIAVLLPNGYECIRYEKGKDTFYYWNKEESASSKLLEDIKNACKAFDEKMDYYMKNYEYIKHNGVELYYKKRDNEAIYDMLIFDDFSRIEFMSERIILRLIYKLSKGKFDSINDDPLYISSIKNKDRELELRIKDWYIGLSKEEENELTNITGTRYIRRIKDDNIDILDKYYIDASTMKDEEYQIIRNSGIILWHEPYFGMMKYGGCTHAYYTAKPKTLDMDDAAPKDKKDLVISFDEYLKLFD